MMRYNPHLLYRFANDYLKLAYFVRFNIGLEMKILDDVDAYEAEDVCDVRVFREVMLTGRLPEFARHIYKESNVNVRDVTP